MGAAREGSTEGGGGSDRLGFFFYRAVDKTVLLFGEETWVILAPMAQRLEGMQVGLLKQIKKSKAKRLRDESWRKVAAKKVRGTQPLRTYLDRKQATVAEWVTLRPISNICARETVYEGGGKIRVP